jgi:spermidine synthase
MLGLAAASGAASVMYQIVWMRRLALVFGSTALATSATLVTLLGGLAIGGWIWGRVADRRPQSTLIVFAAVQIATGFYGFASLWIFRGVQALYLAAYPLLSGRAVAGHASLFAGAQLLLNALAVLVPAVLMGGSLPLLGPSLGPLLGPLLGRRVVFDSSGTVDGVGSVYGWSTLGAAAGTAATTYRLLPAIGLASTIALAAALSILAGAAAFAVHLYERARAVPLNAAVWQPPNVTDDFAGRGIAGREIAERGIEFLLLSALVVSAFAATTFAIGWARLLAMVLGSSVYAYSTLGVVVLAGQGIGSVLYGRSQRTVDGHRRRFALLEFVIAFSTALSLIVAPRLPVLFLRFFPLFRDAFGLRIAAHFVAAALVALVPSLLSGATFPAVVGSLGGAADRVGWTIGSAYAANTIGTVVGACLAGFVLMPAVGLHVTFIVAVLSTVGVGLAVWWRARSKGRAQGLSTVAALVPAVAALLIVIATLPAWPREVFAAGIGFFAPRYEDEALGNIASGMQLLYYRDGASATISVDETGQTLFFRSNGKTEASTDPVDMANQLLLGHLPMLLHSGPRDVFVFGLGTGMNLAAVARYPVQQIDVVEPEPAVVQAARFFDSYTRQVLNDRRVHLIVGEGGDGRDTLLGMRKQYDVVISDLSDIWADIWAGIGAAGGGSVATLEFYRTVGARLKPGGIFAQRIDTHALVPEDFDLLAATFHAVFPHMQVWTSTPGNIILLGSRDSLTWDYGRLAQHFTETQGVAADLESAGIWHPFALFGAQILGETESDALARDIGELHTDDRPVLEFRTPRSLYVETTPMIVHALDYYRRPDPPAIAGFDPEHDLDADGTYLLGFAYASVGWPELAITYMKRSTTMAPNRAVFLVGLGNQYRAAGRIQDADAAFERALRLDLNNLEALLSLGEIRFDEGQLEWTRVLADRALQLAPQDARVHALIGKLLNAER